MTANGKLRLYEVEYELTYVCSQAPSSDEYLKVGHMPWDNTKIKNLNNAKDTRKISYKRGSSEVDTIV